MAAPATTTTTASSTPSVHDFSDNLCAECETGGDIVCCDGTCYRSFHPECIEETLPESDDPWLCFDCTEGVRRCFKCKEYDLEADLVRCAARGCANCFHASEDCLNVKAHTVLKQFVCAHHHCHGCSVRGSARPVVQCFRCQKAYHKECRPADVHVLDEQYFLCMRHVQENEELPDIDPDLLSRAHRQKRLLQLLEAKANKGATGTSGDLGASAGSSLASPMPRVETIITVKRARKPKQSHSGGAPTSAMRPSSSSSKAKESTKPVFKIPKKRMVESHSSSSSESDDDDADGDPTTRASSSSSSSSNGGAAGGRRASPRRRRKRQRQRGPSQPLRPPVPPPPEYYTGAAPASMPPSYVEPPRDQAQQPYLQPEPAPAPTYPPQPQHQPQHQPQPQPLQRYDAAPHDYAYPPYEHAEPPPAWHGGGPSVHERPHDLHYHHEHYDYRDAPPREWGAPEQGWGSSHADGRNGAYDRGPPAYDERGPPGYNSHPAAGHAAARSAAPAPAPAPASSAPPSNPLAGLLLGLPTVPGRGGPGPGGGGGGALTTTPLASVPQPAPATETAAGGPAAAGATPAISSADIGALLMMQGFLAPAPAPAPAPAAIPPETLFDGLNERVSSHTLQILSGRWRCTVCGAKFASPVHLSSHLPKHSAEERAAAEQEATQGADAGGKETPQPKSSRGWWSHTGITQHP